MNAGVTILRQARYQAHRQEVGLRVASSLEKSSAVETLAPEPSPRRPFLPIRLQAGDWLTTFSAFRHYNFRLYFAGLLISVTGTWAQTVAQEWLVYSLTNSPLALGQVAFMMAIPVWVAGPWVGVVIDRVPRRTVLLVTQIVQMVQAFALAALTFSGHVEVWHVMILSAVQGLANAFDAPARQAFAVEMVGKEDLSNAIALNSTMFSLARFVGPAIGALILVTLGTAWAFTINGVTFLAILASLLMMRLGKPLLSQTGQSPLGDLLDGMHFIGQHRTIIALMAIALAVGLLGSSFNTLTAVLAQEVLGKGEFEFGMLKTAIGLGSVGGALGVAYLSSRRGRGCWLILLNVIFPLSLAALAGASLLGIYELVLLSLVAVGISFIPQLSLCNMLIQTTIPDGMRGRVVGVYTLIIFGSFPLGALIGGAMADQVGAPVTIAVNAAALLLVGQLVRLAVPDLKALD